MSPRFSLLLLALACLAPINAPAMYAPPPKFVVQSTDAPNLFIRKDNQRGVIEIRQIDDFKLSWEATIPSYSPLFSTVVLAPDGKHLYHVLGNQQVAKLDDVCVEIYDADGLVTQYLASEVLSELPKSSLVSSTTPATRWRDGEPRPVYSDYIVVKIINGQTARFYSDKHEVLFH